MIKVLPCKKTAPEKPASLISTLSSIVSFTLSELYECPSYKELCNLINGVINEYVDNVEEYVDDVEERALYKDFVEARKESRNKDKEQENANE